MILLTQAAAAQIKSALESRGHGAGVSLAVKPSGCSGFAYAMEFADTEPEDCLLIETDGAKVFVDSKSVAALEGTVIDYKKENMTEGFVFNNPNVTSACGCGKSFSV